jgi:methionyl-tRNA formyltransferase
LAGQTDKVVDSGTAGDLFLPDLSISVKQTLKQENWNWLELDCDHINRDLMVYTISKFSPKMIIYSGYGNQLVGTQLLEMEIPFLHIHSGWLPKYKGSTAFYYSWIIEQYCGVSAFYLRSGIDEGPIVLRKKYPLPQSGVDPDYIYDCAIRADTLIEVIQGINQTGTIPAGRAQTELGDTYYVIHPLLKHLARLSELPSSI